MPSRNLRKEYIPESYYHIYNRGVEKRKIFIDEQDYKVFLGYLKVALSPEGSEIDVNEIAYLKVKKLRRKKFYEDVELLSYCLMPNHFHIMLYQKTNRGIANLMQSVMTGYVMYFNRKYDRVGHLFQERYKASNIDSDSYLWHISRYIHLNPKNWETYPYSSLDYYRHKKTAQWINPKKIIDLHAEADQDYMEFLRDYDSYTKSLDNFAF